VQTYKAAFGSDNTLISSAPFLQNGSYRPGNPLTGRKSRSRHREVMQEEEPPLPEKCVVQHAEYLPSDNRLPYVHFDNQSWFYCQYRLFFNNSIIFYLSASFTKNWTESE
jgi:hypothetical protein